MGIIFYLDCTSTVLALYFATQKSPNSYLFFCCPPCFRFPFPLLGRNRAGPGRGSLRIADGETYGKTIFRVRAAYVLNSSCGCCPRKEMPTKTTSFLAHCDQVGAEWVCGFFRSTVTVRKQITRLLSPPV